jgi:preprotein translocase subunit SecG
MTYATALALTPFAQQRTLVVAPFLIGLLNVLLVLTSVFLICLVLIQRGKGGGLAGAFGGPGGSSAFGTKAGDVFTRITIITAGIWIALAMFQVILINRGGSGSAFQGSSTPIADLPFSDDAATGADTKDTTSTTLPPETGGAGTSVPPNGSAPAPSPEKGIEGLPSAIGNPEPEPATAPSAPAGGLTPEAPTPK